MINPCKPNCLKYPMCISIRALRCEELHHYYHMTVKDGMNGKEAWEHIRAFLPNAGSISNAAQDYPIHNHRRDKFDYAKELEHAHLPFLS